MRYTQPQSGPVRIESQYATSFAYNPATGFTDIARGSPITISGVVPLTSTPQGIGASFYSTANYLTVARRGAPIFQGSFSLIYSFRQVGAVINSGSMFLLGVYAAANSIAIYTLTGANSVLCEFYDAAGTRSLVYSDVFSAGSVNNLALVYDAINGTVRWLNNGLPFGSIVTGVGARNAEATTFVIGGPFAGAPPNHDVSLVAVVGAIASPKVLANPWQLFKSPQRALLASGAPAAPTGTLTSTLGNATIAASGAVLNAGAFASTLANATMAASGAVGSAPSGVFASTLADAAMSAAGAATNAGSFATSLAGASMSAVGAAGSLTGTYSATTVGATMTAAGFIGTAGHFRALILVGGVFRVIPAAQLGTGKKPIVYIAQRLRQRLAAEGTPVILANARMRQLQAGETLDI